jgi:hypothetical protein
MYGLIALILFLAGVANALALYAYTCRRELRVAETDLNNALFREKTFEQVREDFARRPVQAMIPANAIDILAQAVTHSVIQYLAQSMNGPMEVPIFPRNPEKEPPIK